MLYYLVYVEVDVICLIMLALVLTGVSTNFGKSSEVGGFKAVVVTNILLLVVDIVWMFGEHGVLYFAPALNWGINILYMTLTCAMAYFWLVYTTVRLSKREVSTRWRAVAAVPLFLVAAATLSSVWTKWMIYIDAQNVYHRGEYYLFHLTVSLAYIMLPAIASVYRSVNEKNSQRRREALILASFVILPVAGSVIQARFFGVPAALAGASLSMLMVFIGFQNVRIFNDALTGLNNRRRADEFLESRFASAREGRLMRHGKKKSINPVCLRARGAACAFHHGLGLFQEHQR